MSVSRKLFVQVAAEFDAARILAVHDDAGKTSTHVALVRDCAERMAQVFKAANPAFDTTRFMTACGF